MPSCYECKHFTKNCGCGVKKNKKDPIKIVPVILREYGACDFFISII